MLCFGFSSNAQNLEFDTEIEIDSNTTQQTIAPNEEKDFTYKFLLSLDGRRSIVLGENTELGGLKIGTTINNKYKTGIGIYWMRNNIERSGKPGGNIRDSRDTLYFKFGYTSLFFEPVFTINKRWQISTPFHLGSAVIEARYLTTGREKKLFKTTKAPLVEISGVVQYKLLRWLAFGTGIGYRSVLIDETNIKKALEAPVYIFQLKILFGVIWNTYLDKEINDGWDD